MRYGMVSCDPTCTPRVGEEHSSEHQAVELHQGGQAVFPGITGIVAYLGDLLRHPVIRQSTGEDSDHSAQRSYGGGHAPYCAT